MKRIWMEAFEFFACSKTIMLSIVFMLQSHPPDIYQWNISSHFLRASSVSRVREEAWQVLSEVRLAADKTAKRWGIWDRVVVRRQVHWKLKVGNKQQDMKKEKGMKQAFSHNLLQTMCLNTGTTPHCTAIFSQELDNEADPSRTCRDQFGAFLKSACWHSWLQISFGNHLNQYQPVTIDLHLNSTGIYGHMSLPLQRFLFWAYESIYIYIICFM